LGKIVNKEHEIVVEIDPDEVLDMLFFWKEKGPRPVAFAISAAARQKVAQTALSNAQIAVAGTTWNKDTGRYEVHLRKAMPEEIQQGQLFAPLAQS
jgi:hypothetical protein